MNLDKSQFSIKLHLDAKEQEFMSANTILSEALKLPRAERAVIARSLFSSVDELDNPDDDISPELELELELDRILADMNANASSCIPFDQVEKELDELMRK